MEAINTNFSVFLPIWDLMFGTFYMPKDKRPQIYGIAEHMPAGVVGQLLHPFRGMANPLVMGWFALRHPVSAIRVIRPLVWNVLVQVWRSSRRPTRSEHRLA